VSAAQAGVLQTFPGCRQALYEKGRPVVITGDVNTAYAEIDIARPKENTKVSGFMPEEREALGEFFKAGLIDTYRTLHPEDVKYSWWKQVTRARDRNIGWRLDYFLVSPDLKDKLCPPTSTPR
jgi:exodeoxyribonuclease III